MRTLGLALVAVALSLSAGGVAYRTALEPEEGRAAASEEAGAADEICLATESTSVEAAELLAPRRDPSTRYVSLNSRGYNYARPGEYRPPVRPEGERPDPRSP